MYVNVYIHYSLLILCAVVKYKMYGPPSLLQFGIHSYSTVGVQEFESLGKVTDILRVREDSIVMGVRKNRVLERVLFAYTVYFQARTMLSWL